MFSENRPNRLSYRANNGVIDTYIGSIESSGNYLLQAFIGRAIRWSSVPLDDHDVLDEETKGYRLLDSFMTDAISAENLEQIFNRREQFPVQILLVHPNSEFAAVRARARDPDATTWDLSKQGLLEIAKGLSIYKPSFEDKTAQEVLKIIQEQTDRNNIEIRFYNSSPGSPLYFLMDLVLAGRFGNGVTSANLRWELIVNESNLETDVYSLLLAEFDLLWENSHPSLDPINKLVPLPLESEKLAQVFISHSTKDKELAAELKQNFIKKGINAFVAELDIDPGEIWSEEIRRNLVAAEELVFVLSSHSEDSHWVLAECGAAWVLDRPITMATVGCEPSTKLQFINKYKSQEISNKKGKEKLIDSICKRLKLNKD